MTRPTDQKRRDFLKTTAVASAGFWVAGGVSARAEESANDKVAFACFGVGGKGGSDTADAARLGQVVAVCDIDAGRLAGAVKKYPGAKPYQDYRKLLDEMGDSIDAVTVSTPDHMHAPIGLAAMRMGKHCFCQKPLTRTIYESRLMGQVAREMGLATQMGNQGTADDSLREAAMQLKHGAIGTVKEVHVWTNRPIWPQGIPRPEPTPCPEDMPWDLWLGVAPERPYASKSEGGQPAYHPFCWRGWWDFGTGALGDIACHSVSMPFMGLDLRDLAAVSAKTSKHNGDSFPSSSVVTFEFAATDERPPVKLVWYDGGELPDRDLFGGREPGEGGGLAVIGDKGLMFNRNLHDGAEPVEVEFPHSPGHFDEYVRGIKTGEQPMSNFPDYSGPLSEAMLAGNLAVWLAKDGESPRIEWDSKNMKSTNIDGLEHLIKPTYRGDHVLDV